LQLLELLTTHGVQCGGSLYWLLKDGSPNFEVAAFLASHGANLRVKGDDGYELYQSTTTELRAFFRALDPSLR